MSSPQHFDGLEEDKITWHSNSKRPRLIGPTVWEAEEITRFSNQDCSRGGTYPGLKENKITWCSNYNRNCDRNVLGLEENKTTGFSSIMPFSYPRLIVLEAEEIAWRSNKLGIVSQ